MLNSAMVHCRLPIISGHLAINNFVLYIYIITDFRTVVWLIGAELAFFEV